VFTNETNPGGVDRAGSVPVDAMRGWHGSSSVMPVANARLLKRYAGSERLLLISFSSHWKIREFDGEANRRGIRPQDCGELGDVLRDV
jgi:hypothetical protein